MLSRHPDWSAELAPFQAEAAWTIGDWETVGSIPNPPPIAKVFMAIQSGGNVPDALKVARRDIGSSITAGDYSRSYDSILQLHLLYEVEMIHSADLKVSRLDQIPNAQNSHVKSEHEVDFLIAWLADRFEKTLPSFHAREEILSRRRAAFSLVRVPQLRPELGQSWIQSAKIARKAGYDQTAYSAALQAREAEAPFAFIQQAKLTRAHGGILKALRELEQPIAKLIRESERADVIDLTGTGHHRPRTDEDLRRDRSLAKVSFSATMYADTRPLFSRRAGRRRAGDSTRTISCCDSGRRPSLGRRWNPRSSTSAGTTTCSLRARKTWARYRCSTTSLVSTTTRRYSAASSISTRQYRVCSRSGSTSRRTRKERRSEHLRCWLLTISAQVVKNVESITNLMVLAKDKIMPFQFLTAFPQMISRITHPTKRVRETLVRILSRVVRAHSQQALWPIVGSLLSKRKDRIGLTETILRRAEVSCDDTNVTLTIRAHTTSTGSDVVSGTLSAWASCFSGSRRTSPSRQGWRRHPSLSTILT